MFFNRITFAEIQNEGKHTQGHSSNGRTAVYVTNYIRTNSQPELSDDELASQLIDMIDCGANLIDIRTDMFCRNSNKVTRDLFADEKQKNLISQIHKAGAEVLMSTHIFEYISPQNILEIGKIQQSRGADIAKIVTEVNSEKELLDAFETITLLKKHLNIPFLFLANGKKCRKLRLLGPMFGVCMYLCVNNESREAPQPTIAEAKNMIELIYGKGENNNE